MDAKIFHKISYGLYVISSAKEGKLNGQIANTVFQIASEPAIIAIGINKNNLTNEYIKSSKAFTVAILPKTVTMSVIGHFGFQSGRDINKYDSVSYKIGKTGVPYLIESTLGYMEAEVIDSIEAATHTLFIGKVVNAEVFSDEEPMTYAYYHQIKRGAAPLKPTPAVEPSDEKKAESEAKEMRKYECAICGYVYDPAVGDPDSGIAPGTPFEDIPEDWVCPICGAGKDQFEPVD